MFFLFSKVKQKMARTKMTARVTSSTTKPKITKKSKELKQIEELNEKVVRLEAKLLLHKQEIPDFVMLLVTQIHLGECVDTFLLTPQQGERLKSLFSNQALVQHVDDSLPSKTSPEEKKIVQFLAEEMDNFYVPKFLGYSKSPEPYINDSVSAFRVIDTLHIKLCK